MAKLWTFEVEGSKRPKRQYYTLTKLVMQFLDSISCFLTVIDQTKIARLHTKLLGCKFWALKNVARGMSETTMRVEWWAGSTTVECMMMSWMMKNNSTIEPVIASLVDAPRLDNLVGRALDMASMCNLVGSAYRDRVTSINHNEESREMVPWDRQWEISSDPVEIQRRSNWTSSSGTPPFSTWKYIA